MAASPPPPASAVATQQPEPEPVATLSTRVRALGLGGSGGGGAAPTVHGGPGRTYPMCQVDHCRADLTGAKAYHRRHKVCVAHSRAAGTPVAGMTQRFCQMCSRFHPLAEFDGLKRSCRRRLTHARRRARFWPPGPRLLLHGNQENAPIVAQDAVDLFPVIPRLS
ncbi:unnamed protein product [Urochloa humidicola]